MTYGQIYNQIVRKCWGQATVPTIAPEHIREMIVSAHKKIQRQYNFWFNLFRTTISTVELQASYALPVNYKEMERCYFAVNGQDFFTEPLIPLEIAEDIDYGHVLKNGTSEYPTHYIADGTNLILYPTPIYVRTLHMLLWKFIPAPDITNVNIFNVYEDVLSINLHDAIIYWVLSELKLEMDEAQSSQLYGDRYFDALNDACLEDRRRRQKMELVTNYV